MARVLVIGGTLFMGRALVEQLLARGDHVVIMHRGGSTPFGDKVAEIRCDRNDVPGVRRALQHERFELVFDNVYDWERGTTAAQVRAAAEAASPGLHRYVFTSSVAVYPPGGPYDERDPLVGAGHPDPYGLNKAESERALFALKREAGVPVTTLRPAFVYGRHNPLDREAFFWDRIRADRPIIIPDDGSSTMQWVCADDVVRAAVAAADADIASGHAYHLAGPPVTHLEFVQALARAAGREARLVHVPRAQIQAAGGGIFAPPFYFGVYLDIPPITVRGDRLRSELQLELRPLEEGLRETYLWYARQQRPPADYSWEDGLIAAAGAARQ